MFDDAPRGPGVYVFVGDDGRVRYVGKAIDVRRRLRQHGVEGDVRWVETATEEEALLLESDLIAALRPPRNKTHLYDARWAYVVLDGDSFRLAAAEPGVRSYGCFPHLGTGLSSLAGVACSDGYAALLRLLWAAVTDEPFPRRISGPSPPDSVTIPGGADRRGVHELLAGRSARLLDDVLLAAGDPVRRPALRRDALAARRFFDVGPRRLRDLRLRHGIRRAPLDRPTVERLLLDDLRAAVGPIEAPAAEPVGLRRTRHGWLA